MDKKKRLLSGNRPTGLLHLGNYIGALQNWVKLQDEYECFYMVADWHALTSEYQDTSELPHYVEQMFIDWLAVGLDPERSTLFVQSDVIQHAELTLLLGMFTPLAWLERCPTYKEQLQQLGHKEIATYGFLGYPVLQTADIVIYRAEVVPIGEDQIPHLELAREIVRRVNYYYGKGNPILPEPQPILSPVPKLLGIDGRKMSCDQRTVARELAEITPISDKSVAENSYLSFVVFASDQDGTTPSLTSFDLPANAVFNDLGTGSGLFEFAPDYAQSGVYTVGFVASDGSLGGYGGGGLSVKKRLLEMERALAAGTPAGHL